MTVSCSACVAVFAVAAAVALASLHIPRRISGHSLWIAGLLTLAGAQVVLLLNGVLGLDPLGSAAHAALQVTAIILLVLGVESFQSQQQPSRRALASGGVVAVVMLMTGVIAPGEPLRILQEVVSTGLLFAACALVLTTFPILPGRSLTAGGFLVGGITATLQIVDNLLISPETTDMTMWLAFLGPVATILYGTGLVVVVANWSIDALRSAASDLEKTQEHLLQLAEVDPLTRCANRHALRAWFESWDEDDVVSVVLVDVDDLKGINDRHGHAAGDEALQLVARVLKSTTRTDDLVVRWGGDEFLVVLSGAGQLTAMRRFGNLIRLLSESASDFPYDEELRVSWGVSSCATREGITAALEQADQHMYANKERRRAGRR